MAHDEPPHQDLRCLQIQLFLSLVVKELIILINAPTLINAPVSFMKIILSNLFASLHMGSILKEKNLLQEE